jgi:hypothetical protein
MFAHWRITEPKIGEAFLACRCGAPAPRETGAGFQPHTINGWRRSLHGLVLELHALINFRRLTHSA